MQKKIFRICAVFMVLSGLVIVFSSLYPIFYYEWESAERYPMLISPLVDEETASFKFTKSDYTKAENWFPNANFSDGQSDENSPKIFTISIPKLSIDAAIVNIGGDDLSESLIQFPGTAVPGEIGNTVVFGHSILPIYYDPKRYISIFSTLNKLQKGDEIYILFDNVNYKYKVENLFEVKPDDIQILEQSTNDSFLTLVTCSPPGDPRKPKRLIVRSRLEQFNN